MQRLAVLGAGSWGTTFAKVLADAGRAVTLWARRASVAERISTTAQNPEYLPGVDLPRSIAATSDLDEAVDGADAVVLAVPSQSLRENLTVFRDQLRPGVPMVSLAKGVEIGTGLRMSEIIERVGGVDPQHIVVLAGPNLALEIAAGHPTATLLAGVDHDLASAVARACATAYFRPFTTTDVVGAEIAGTGKNIIALACGIADGLGLGLNTVASLMTRGLAEVARLGQELGAVPATFAGLSGLGDLVATCSSPLSRNRSLGRRLGIGLSLDEALEASGGQVAEGVVSCRSVRDLAVRHDVDMPVTEAVYRVCYQHLPPAAMIDAIMSRPLSTE
ncbi:NAD(P)-dependent glycerol-3-phosphate dehydrogenase [Nakamurella sp. YIM 132084]|uniref:Glycerol-3-phosphate dehydrogenase [NAD(P)+] n=1 Tax=Nakamurella leprariae TaxID=2803911 RepID=A0A939C2C1_9ACTN|nr:NAD(P)-dependent glycerol-3-phosphate dehydrogenase [Nakamurella leprariae]